MQQWFETPPGRVLLAWEQAEFDRAVGDIFGYHALQMGLPELDALRANRMPHKWLALREAEAATGPARPDLVTEFSALPFEENSLDLVVLPHSLELNFDPHATLREVERVLMPEGQVVISGFNTASLWRVRQAFTFHRNGAPWDAKFIGLLRLREWLRVLGFELNGGKFGCYAPPFTDKTWLERFSFLEKAGSRWWPVTGGVYVVRAVKRVHGMRMITPAWRQERARRRALAPVSQRTNGNAHQRHHE